MDHEAVDQWALLDAAVLELELRLDTAGETAWAGYFRRARQMLRAGDQEALTLLSQAMRRGSEFTRMCRSYDRDGLSRDDRRSTRDHLARASMRVAAMLAPITDEPIAGAHNEDDISWAGVALKLVIFGSFCAAIVFGIRALYAEAISPGLKYSIATAVVAGIVHALRDVMEHD